MRYMNPKRTIVQNVKIDAASPGKSKFKSKSTKSDKQVSQ